MMRCEHCQGTGKETHRPAAFNVGESEAYTIYWRPCPDCGGYGEVSCCQGEVGDGKIANTGEKDG